MRKLLASACLLGVFGLAHAGEVTLMKFDKEKKEVTVKEDEAEKTYTITEKTKFAAVDEDGTAKKLTYEDALKGLNSPKSVGVLRFEITAKDGQLTEVKVKRRKANAPKGQPPASIAKPMSRP